MKHPLIARIALDLFSACVLFCTGAPVSAIQLSTHIADYTLQARLFPSSRSVEGDEILTWRNRTTVPASDIYLHLYLNAYRSSKSTFAREGEQELPPADSGAIDIRILETSDGTDLLPKAAFVHPDDDNTDDMTVLHVPLRKPVMPGDSLRLHAAFTSTLPLSVGRSNAASGCEYFLVGQWFPKIAVFEGPHGWNAHQFHYNTEFYADFGEYDVTITVPENYIVGATGVRKSSWKNDDGTRTLTYHQSDVIDFAWTASPRFVEFRRSFVRPDRLPTTIILLMQPEHLGLRERYERAAMSAMKRYGEWYGEYPYPTLTIVDPPRTSESGGMEYPTFITVGADEIMPDDILDPESVTVHEFAHQYWYAMVATNEFEHPWLDEGFATYSELCVMENTYGPMLRNFRIAGGIPLYGIPLLTVDGFPLIAVMDKVKVRYPYIDRYQFLRDELNDPVSQPGYREFDRSTYVTNAYIKPGLVLWTLKNTLGEQTMERIMRAYFQRYRFSHPRPEDFYAVVNEISGKDMSWFFRQFIDETLRLDYAVDGLKSSEIDGKFRTEVVFRRLGEARMPVDLRITCANGETIDDSWDGNDRWIRKVYVTSSPVTVAQVDPGNKLVLDVNSANNSYKAETDHTAVMNWTSKWLFWMQHLLQFLTSLC